MHQGSMMQTCRNIKVHVVNTDICRDIHECLWIGLHEKVDLSMCTVEAKNCLQNMTAETLK